MEQKSNNQEPQMLTFELGWATAYRGGANSVYELMRIRLKQIGEFKFLVAVYNSFEWIMTKVPKQENTFTFKHHHGVWYVTLPFNIANTEFDNQTKDKQ